MRQFAIVHVVMIFYILATEYYGSGWDLLRILRFCGDFVLLARLFLLSSPLMDKVEVIEKLRRDGNLQEARRVGEEAVAADPNDGDVLSALVSVYLDIETMCVTNKVTCYLDEIGRRLDELLSMLNDGDRARSRHRKLQMSLLPGYEQIVQLETLSARDGHEREAYAAARSMFSKGFLSPGLYEIYGTIIYRYARVAMTESSSRPVKHLLTEYLSLPMPRPSRLHSLMLRLAVRCARKYSDFKFDRFLALWDPALFRTDDTLPTGSHNSLASAAMELVIDSESAHLFPDLLNRINAPVDRRLTIVREAFDSIVTRCVKSGDNQRAIDLLDLYSIHATLHASCPHHSHLLALALKVMDGDEVWRFVQFFVDWNAQLFRKEDFKQTVLPGGQMLQSLARRSLNRCFSAIKADNSRHSHLLARVIEIFDSVERLMPDGLDEIGHRRRAMMLNWLNFENEAVERMCYMARQGHCSSAFWHDFAMMTADKSCKIGLLALGLLSGDENAPDRDYVELRLSMAQQLHIQGDDDGAVTELDACREVAEPMARYGAIRMTIAPDAKPNYDNQLLYHSLAAEALAMIYSNIPTEKRSVISREENLIVAACASESPVMLDTVIWPILRELSPGDNVELKREGDSVVMVRPIGGSPYASLIHKYGIVLNNSTIQCAGRPAPIHCEPVGLKVSTPVSLSLYIDAEQQYRATDIKAAPRQDVLDRFDQLVAAVYHVDNQKVSLSAGPQGPWIELNRDNQELKIGSLIRVTYFKDTRGKIFVIDSCHISQDIDCEAITVVSGCLEGDVSGYRVRNVVIPGYLVSEAGVTNHTMVKCRAVVTPCGFKAFSLQPYT